MSLRSLLWLSFRRSARGADQISFLDRFAEEGTERECGER